MKIAVGSDIHLEFGDLHIRNTEGADVLILGGDILVAKHFKTDLENRHGAGNMYRDFIRRCSGEFRHVVAIAGNHEFYGGYWNETLDILRTEYGRHSNVHFLENDTVTIDGVLFVGATLWTDLNRGNPVTEHIVRSTMNDFDKIRNDEHGYSKISVMDVKTRNSRSIAHLRDVLANNRDTPTIVVGHHAPSFRGVHPVYDTASNHHLNFAYYSSYDEIMHDNPQIKLWTCGHVHHRHRYYVGDTLVVASPRGYIGIEPQADNFRLGIVDLHSMPTKDEVDGDYSWETVSTL